MITYRDCCGTLRGMIAHQTAGEAPCGWCVQAEAVARLATEGFHRYPDSPGQAAAVPSVTASQAKANRKLLAEELDIFEATHLGYNPKHPFSADELAARRKKRSAA
jgi:hypothetical protein